MGATYEDFSFTNATSMTVNATKPTGTTNGELLIAIQVSTLGATYGAPSGWTQIGSSQTNGAAWYRIVGSSPGSDGATYAFTQSAALSAMRVTIARFSNANQTTPLLDSYITQTNGSNAVMAALNPTGSDITLFSHLQLQNATSAVTVPSGMTQTYNSTTSATKAGAVLTGQSSGSTGTKTWTNNSTTWVGLFVAIKTGTTAYSETPSDSATASDSAAKAVGKSAADSATPTDASSRHPRKSVADSAASSDAIATKGVTKALTDSTAPTEAPSLRVTKPTADSVSTSDAAVRAIGPRPSDSLTPSDARAFSATKGLTDSASAVEDITLILGSLRSINEVSEAVDLASKFITPGAKSDSVATSELATLLLSKGLADSVTASDVATRLVQYLRTTDSYAFVADIPAKHISLTFRDVIGAVEDWPVEVASRVIAGVVRNHETGSVVEGATVRLFRSTDDAICQTATSGPDGSYSFDRDADDPYDYYVTAQYLEGATQVHGITDRGLVPEVT